MKLTGVILCFLGVSLYGSQQGVQLYTSKKISKKELLKHTSYDGLNDLANRYRFVASLKGRRTASIGILRRALEQNEKILEEVVRSPTLIGASYPSSSSQFLDKSISGALVLVGCGGSYVMSESLLFGGISVLLLATSLKLWTDNSFYRHKRELQNRKSDYTLLLTDLKSLEEKN